MPHEEYPKMVYGPKGASKTVTSADEQSKLGKGWTDKPSAEHFPTQPVSPYVAHTATVLNESDLDALATRLANIVGPVVADIIVARLTSETAPNPDTEGGE